MKKSFVLYMDQYQPIKKLTLVQKGCLLDAIFNYQIGEEVECIDEVVEMAFQFFKQTFDRDNNNYLKKCKKNKENARKRWGAKNANECDRMRMDAKHADSGTDTDKIVRVIDDSDKSISSEPGGSDKEADKKKLEDEFERFWNLYQKKDNRKGCWSKWQKLKAADKDKIFETLPAYVKSTPDQKYRKNPATYLNQEAWNNEIIPAEGAHKGDRFRDPTYYGESTYKENDVF